MDSPDTLVIAFGGAGYRDDRRALDELAAAYPNSVRVGCSTSGEIEGDAIHDATLSVAVLRFEKTRVRAAWRPVASANDSFAAARALVEELRAPDLRSVLVLSDGLSVNGSELARGFNSLLPPGVVVTGGLAGDGDRFQSTWILRDGAPCSHAVCAVGLYGPDVIVGHGSKGGWDLFGPERRVTRSEGNVLFELDGRPALALYKEYLGELATGLPATALLYPLALRRADSSDSATLVRTVLGIDEARQSMTFAGDIPQGALVQLMRANFDRLVDGASLAAAMAGSVGPTPGDVLAIAISCVGRRLVLGQRAEEEVEATLDALPQGANQIGFYSYGEISPLTQGTCDLHNQTMTLTTLSER